VVEDRQLGLEIAVPLTVVIVSAPRGEILRATFLPHLELNFAFIFIITGVLGTTISPYMFFWEASEEVEEEEAQHLIGTDGKPRIGRAYLTSLRLDNLIGMVFSETATWAIIVVAATVLHANGVTNVATAADAARALDPLVRSFPSAGFLAKGIFAAGILGLGFMAIPYSRARPPTRSPRHSGGTRGWPASCGRPTASTGSSPSPPCWVSRSISWGSTRSRR
jgi:Mn2+/Fe2+ NRAMP family transporter